MKKILSLTLMLSAVSALQASNQTLLGQGMSYAFGDRGASSDSSDSSNSSATSSRPFNFDDYKIGKSTESFTGTDEAADESRLIEALGENPYEYMTVLGINNLGSRWNSTVESLRFAGKAVTAKLSLKDLVRKTVSQVAEEKKSRARDASKYYQDNFSDKAFEVMSKDLQAFEQKVAQSRDQSMYDRLKFLLDSAKLAKTELLKKEAGVEYEKFRPSTTAISLDQIMAEVESLIRSSDDNAVVLYKEIATKLKKIQQEVRSLKTRYPDSIAAAVDAAIRSQAAAKDVTSREFYDDVIAELNIVVQAEDKAGADLDEVNKRVKDLIAQQVNNSPVDALLEAETALAHLKDELYQLNNQRGTKNQTKINTKKHEIHLQEEVISQLKDKVKASESNDRVLARKVNDLLSKYEDNLDAVLEYIDSKIIKSGSRGTKEDKALRDIIEKMIIENKKLESKRDDIKKELDNFMSDIVKFDDKTENPYEKIEKLKKDLLKVEKELKEKKAKPSSIYAADVKELQKKVDLYKSAIERLLKDEAEKFDKKVEDKLKSMQKKYSDNKTAFKTLLPKGSIPSYMQTASNWWSGLAKKTPEDMIEDITKPVDKAVAKKLNDKIKEAEENDPVNAAIARLNTASALEVPGAVEDVLAARLSQLGLSIENLDMNTRQQLAGHVGNTSRRLIIIMNDPRLSDARKQDEKRTVMQAMVKEIGYLLASYASGVSAEALATGDLTTIATDKLINTIVGGPVNYTPSSSMNGSYAGSRNINTSRSYQDPKVVAYQTLDLSPGASPAEIRSAYLRLARENHPDMQGDVAKFQSINEAYQLLNASL